MYFKGRARALILSVAVATLLVVAGLGLTVLPHKGVAIAQPSAGLQTSGYVKTLASVESAYCFTSTGTANHSWSAGSGITATYTNLAPTTPPGTCSAHRNATVLQTSTSSGLRNMVMFEINNTTSASNITSGFYQYVMNVVPIYTSPWMSAVTNGFWAQYTFGHNPPELRMADCIQTGSCGGGGGGSGVVSTGTGGNPSCGYSATYSAGALGIAMSETECLSQFILHAWQNVSSQPWYIISVAIIAAIAGATPYVGPFLAVAATILLIFGWNLVQTIDGLGGNVGIYQASCSVSLLWFMCPQVAYGWVAPNPVPTGF